jgi:hypothetical protein
LGRVASADHVPQGAAALEALVDVLPLSVPHRAEAPGHPVVLQNSVGVLPQRPGLYSCSQINESIKRHMRKQIDTANVIHRRKD